MADIRIRDLPNATGPNPPVASDAIAIDGATTRRTTIQEAVNVGAPVASQAKAEAGVDNNDRMTALTTKQSIRSEVGVTIASSAQGEKADTSLQPATGVFKIASFAAASAATIPTAISTVEAEFYDPNVLVPSSLAGGSRFKRVDTEPAHDLKFQNGGWWEIDEAEISIEMAGATTAAADNKAAVDRAGSAAIALKRTLVFPSGSFKTMGNHAWNSITIRGEGRSNSSLICVNVDPSTWVVRLGDISHMRDLRIGFDASIPIVGATRGQYVGFYSGNTGRPLCKGARIETISIEHVGSGIHDAVDPTFSATFTDIEVRDFTFALMDFTSNSRTQNVYFQIYAGRSASGRNNSTYVFNFEGSDDTGSTFIGLNAESTISESAFRFRNVHANVMTGFHAEDWVSKTTDCQLFDLDRSSAKIGAASVYYCVLKNNCTLFRLGSTKYQEGGGPTQTPQALLSIDILSVKDLTSDEARTQPVTNSSGITLFRRTVSEAAEGQFFVDVKSYIPYTVYGTTDEAWYNSFASSGDIRFASKGQMIQNGVTADRPLGNRRNAYISRFYDTTANAELIFHPSLGWIPPLGNVKRVQSFTASGTIQPETSAVIVSATGGNVVLTLPKTPGGSLSRELTIRRVDNSGNTVTFAPASGDTVGAISVAGLSTKRVMTDGFTSWLEA